MNDFLSNDGLLGRFKPILANHIKYNLFFKLKGQLVLFFKQLISHNISNYVFPCNNWLARRIKSKLNKSFSYCLNYSMYEIGNYKFYAHRSFYHQKLCNQVALSNKLINYNRIAITNFGVVHL